mgnify:CR=1 FL=1
MISKFLTAKHWQLFSLMVGVPFVTQFIMMGTMFLDVFLETSQNEADIFSFYKFFPLIILFYMGMLFGWFWAIAIGLQNMIPESVKMKTNKFKIFFFIPVIYIFCITLLLSGFLNGMFQNVTEPSFEILGALGGIIFPLHILSMFGVFYCLYFVAKTIKTIELQKEVSFGEFAGEFFLLWFYYVGIWIIQPKINKMVENENTTFYT